MDIVTEWEEIPQFTCEHDEAKFWLLHRLDPKLMEQSVVGADQSESTTITLRMDDLYVGGTCVSGCLCVRERCLPG